MLITAILLLVGLELKHFVADYLLQSPRMIAGKGKLTSAGGYLHAGIHAFGSLLILLLAGIGLSMVAMLVVVEFVLHYVLDFAKVHYSQSAHLTSHPQRFWALHGFDQFLHQLTYAGMLYFAIASLPA